MHGNVPFGGNLWESVLGSNKNAGNNHLAFTVVEGEWKGSYIPLFNLCDVEESIFEFG